MIWDGALKKGTGKVTVFGQKSFKLPLKFLKASHPPSCDYLSFFFDVLVDDQIRAKNNLKKIFNVKFRWQMTLWSQTPRAQDLVCVALTSFFFLIMFFHFGRINTIIYELIRDRTKASASVSDKVSCFSTEILHLRNTFRLMIRVFHWSGVLFVENIRWVLITP